jgi:hypothetical protein
MAKVVDNANLVTIFSCPNYASMFRLEKMMLNRFSKFKVRVQFSKRIAGYSNTQGARGAGGWGWGFNTPLKV